MTTATLEHANITIDDLDHTVELLCGIFEWTIRWSGTSMHGGRVAHVGDETSYLSLYEAVTNTTQIDPDESYENRIGLNHIGVEVDNLDQVEQRIHNQGLNTHMHDDYDPGRRFYFALPNSLEIEVVSYQ